MDGKKINTQLEVQEAILKALGGNPAALTDTVVGMSTLLSSVITQLTTVVNQLKAPVYSSVTVITAPTSAVTGATYTPFGNVPCAFIDLVNHTGFDVEYRRNGAGEFITIPTGQSRIIEGITNANQISVRRKDGLNTSITVRAEAYVL